jgi:hypothetical protein
MSDEKIMIKKKICFCTDTDAQVDILNVKQVWAPIKYSYDRFTTRMLPIDMKMIGYADRKVLHEVNPQIASSWKEIERGDSEIIIGDTHTGTASDVLNTTQEFFSSKEQLLKAIEKIAVKKPTDIIQKNQLLMYK